MTHALIANRLRKLHAPNHKELQKILERLLTKEYAPLIKLKPGKILDLGAHIGLATYYFNLLFPDKEIISFEPNPDTFQYLLKNLSKAYQKVLSINAAVVVSENDTKLYLPHKTSPYYGWSWGNSLIREFWNKKQNVRAINVFPYDFRSVFTPRISLCKIDIEGYEYKLLNALHKSKLTLTCPYYIVEFHYTNKATQSDLNKILRQFKKFGYKIYIDGKLTESVIYRSGKMDVCHIFKS